MAVSSPLRIRTISEFHRLRGLPPPVHPLFSIVDYGTMPRPPEEPVSLVLDFYSIALKRSPGLKLRYGQQTYDFDEGVLFFIAPGQVFSVGHDADVPGERSGWLLKIHPDFLYNTPLAGKMGQYEYFSYAANEALFLSDREETVLNGIVAGMEEELQTGIDRFSGDIVIAQLELLLRYAERFYQRQFVTRKIANHQLLERLEAHLSGAFRSEVLSRSGIPTVQSVAEALAVSPGYLGSMLRHLTGQSTQQHIHDKLLERAKEQLSTTALSVSEIAYALGFEHPQSFSKLFKAKTLVSPLTYRASFEA